MRKHPDLPAEELLQRVLDHDGKVISDADFKDLLYRFHHFTLYMAYRYRTKIIQVLIENGIKVDVFGQSWKTCPLRNHVNFVWHEKDLTIDESLEIWQQSKIALNIMSWHKNAITERIINSMLQKAVVLTERNPYLEQQFKQEEDILFYDLAKLDQLPKIVHSFLASPDRLADISENGYQKALQTHTWKHRGEEMITMARQDAASMYL